MPRCRGVAELLDVGDRRHGRVVLEFSPRRRAAAAALIELDDAPVVWIEVAAVIGLAAAAWATMDDEHRRPLGVAGDFPRHGVQIGDLQHAFVVRFDGGVQHVVEVGHRPGNRSGA